MQITKAIHLQPQAFLIISSIVSFGLPDLADPAPGVVR